MVTQNVAKQLEHRLRLETAIANMSHILLIKDSAQINDVLGILGKVVAANRTYIFEARPDEILIDNTYEWCSPGTEPQIDKLKGLGVNTFPWWTSKLRSNETIVIENVSKLPDELSDLREMLSSQDVKSLLVVPMFSRGRLSGFLGFDDTQNTRVWQKEDMGLLRTASDILVAYFDRKHARDEIIEYQQKLRSMTMKLALAEEHERHRIATELHSRITQTLVFTKMKVDSLGDSCSSDSMTDAIREISRHIHQTIKDTQSVTFEISFPTLYEIGFEAALAEWLDEQVGQKHGITTIFVDNDKVRPLDNDVKVTMFMAARELLTNVVKHAQAEKIKVSVNRRDNMIHVTVADDGIGFNCDAKKVGNLEFGGFGLFNIRERLNYIGGRLIIQSKPNQGTKATFSAPLKI